jgi:hypothetical protein
MCKGMNPLNVTLTTLLQCSDVGYIKYCRSECFLMLFGAVSYSLSADVDDCGALRQCCGTFVKC